MQESKKGNTVVQKNKAPLRHTIPNNQFLDSAKNLKALQLVMDFDDHEGSVYHISRFSETRFITSSQDQTIKIWDSEELRIITTLEVNDYITVLEVIPYKFLLAAIGHNSDYFFAWDGRDNF